MATEKSGRMETIDDLLDRYNLGPREEIEFTPREATSSRPTDELLEPPVSDEAYDPVLIKRCKVAIRTRLSGRRRNHGSTERGLWAAVSRSVTGVPHDTLRRHFVEALASLGNAPDIEVAGDLYYMPEDAALAFERKQSRRARADQRQIGDKPRYVRRRAGKKAGRRVTQEVPTSKPNRRSPRRAA